MLSSLCDETQIKNRARKLCCAESVLALLSGVVSQSRLSQALRGHKALDPKDAKHILGVLTEMEILEQESGLPVDWRRVSDVQNILLLRRIRRIDSEMSREGHE